MENISNKIIKIILNSLIFKIIINLNERLILFFIKYNFIKIENLKKTFFLLKPSFKIAKILRFKKYHFFKDTKNKDLKKLINDGFLKYEKVISKKKVNEVIQYINKKKIYNSSQEVFANKTYKINNFKKDQSSYFCLNLDDSLNTFNKLNLTNNNKIKNIIKNYFFKKKPSVFSINVMINKAGKLNMDIQNFHRDFDSVDTLVLMILLTDVNKSNGATQVIKSSQYNDYSKYKNKKILKKNMKNLSGNAGDVILLDNFVLHKGNPNFKNIKYMIWCRLSYQYSLMYYMTNMYLSKKKLLKIKF